MPTLPQALLRLRSRPGILRALWLLPPEAAPGALLSRGLDPGGPRSWSFSLGSDLEPGEVRRPDPRGQVRLEALGPLELVLARPVGGESGGFLWVETEQAVAGALAGGLPDAELLELAREIEYAHLDQIALEADRERRALARIGEDSAALLHDLRNDLTYGLLLLEGGQAGLQTLRDHLGRLRELCQGQLGVDQSSREAPAPIDLATFLREVVGEAERLSAAAGQVGEVVLHCQGEGRVWGAAAPLRRLVGNLLLNALAASPRGKVVELWAGPMTAEQRAAGQHDPEAFDNGPSHDYQGTGRPAEIVISISDQGRGMDAAARARLSRPGQSETARGTGFGSSSAAACARRLGTRLQLSSRPTRGTVAWFTLDAAPAPGTDLHLVVDRHAPRRRRRATQLRAAGVNVVACSSPNEARGVLSSNSTLPNEARGSADTVDTGGSGPSTRPALTLELARGEAGTGLSALLRACREGGVAVGVRGVVDAHHNAHNDAGLNQA